jgi:hypothetical protein
MDRCDTWVLGASTTEELQRVIGKRSLTEQEILMISSWSSATSTGLDIDPTHGDEDGPPEEETVRTRAAAST